MKVHIVLLVFCSLVFVSCSKSLSPSKNPNPNNNHFEQGGYVLNWENNDPNFVAGIKQKLIETFFTVYPQLVKDFNPAAAKAVLFKIDTAYKGVAATSGSKIVFNPRWFDGHPNDIDVVTHEGMHVVQAYPAYDPWWLVEGIADYVRYKYGVANAAGGWSLPDVNSTQKYDNGYRVTARFLSWCEKKKPGSVKTFDTALRNNTYSAGLWTTVFGKTVDALWDEYIADPAL